MTRLILCAILLKLNLLNTNSKTLEISTVVPVPQDEGFDNNIIDFDEEYTVKFNKKYGSVPWHTNDFKRNSHKYTIIRDINRNNGSNVRYDPYNSRNNSRLREETTTEDFKVIPLELISTTENALVSIFESTTEQDLTVIPLSTTIKIPSIKIEQTVTLPTTTEYDTTTEIGDTTTKFMTAKPTDSSEEIMTTWEPLYLKTDNNSTNITKVSLLFNETLPTADKIEIDNKNFTKFNTTKTNDRKSEKIEALNQNTTSNVTSGQSNKIVSEVEIDNKNATKLNATIQIENRKSEKIRALNENTTTNITSNQSNRTKNKTFSKTENRSTSFNKSKNDDAEVPVFTELDTEDFENIPEDYYDSKDVLPTSAPKTDAISVLFGLAGSVVESVVETVAERVVPKSIYDLFKRMQRQNEALEAERLRSREENGGIGQFGRGILKSLSSGLSRPLSQLMAGGKEAGSLDTDRGFVTNVVSSVSSVASAANTYLDAFKDKVQAIYPGTVWCGDGHSAQARSSSELGLFFFTDTCCRQHDACKIYIKAGETKYGLTNTGLFTRSHCSCDSQFRECLRRTNSLVSAQIGLTYFNVLGPQCFRRAHPIVRCMKRTRLTGQKCEEYELDYTKPRMWQWFDNETF